MSASSPLVHPAASAPDVRNVNHPVRQAKLTRAEVSTKAAIPHKPAKKRNRIPPVQRLRVMEKYALGRNQTAIASEEKINRETVARIVTSAEMEAFTEEIRGRWRGLCDLAIKTLVQKLQEGDKSVAFRVLESNSVIPPQGQVQSLQAAPKSTGDDRVKQLMEAFAGVAIERARVFKTPFPELAEVAKEHDIKLGFELNGSDEADEEDNEI
jgi:hypothetical protein